MTMLDKKKAKGKYVDENGVERTKARCFFRQVHCSILTEGSRTARWSPSSL